MSERRGLHSLLRSTRVYSFIQSGLGRTGTADRVRELLFPELARGNTRVLDIGCGPAAFLAEYGTGFDVDYVGFDPIPAYIDSGRERFPDATLHVGTTETVRGLVTGTFDLAVAMGVLHHVDDETATAIAAFAHDRLVVGGRFVTIDPTFVDNQHPVARLLARLDRGKHVRTATRYRELVTEAFDESATTASVHSGWLRVPYNHAVIVAVR